ncbi:hypothetical protein Vretimale_13905, partial [Volvox reticuliferus]
MISQCCTGVMTTSLPFDIPTRPLRREPITEPAVASEAATVQLPDTQPKRPLHTNIRPNTANVRANILVQYKSRPGYLRLAPQDRDEVLMTIIQNIPNNPPYPYPEDTTATGLGT